jgi:hypothetical protein
MLEFQTMETITQELRTVRVLRDGLWHICRLGEVKAGETFMLWEGDTIIAKAVAVQDGKFDEACGGRVTAEMLPLYEAPIVTVSTDSTSCWSAGSMSLQLPV